MNSYDLETLLGAIAIGIAVATLVYLGLALIFFGTANAIPDTYKECVASGLPEWYCELLYPPLNRESV